MKKPFMKIVFAVAVIILPQIASSAHACSCLPLPSPYKAYQEASAVFVGKVVSSKDIPFSEQGRDKVFTVYKRHFRFAVEEPFKGVKNSEVELSAGRIDSSCYSGFAVGESYLVYAYGTSEAALSSGMCTRTNSLAWAHDDLRHIRAFLKGVPEPRVYGSVTRIDSDLTKSQSSVVSPLEGIKIIVEGAGRRFEAVTDKQGFFSIADMPDGEYTARPLLPDKYMSYFPAEEKFILNSKENLPHSFVRQGKTAYAQFRVGWNNKLSGRILDAEGNPIKRAKAAILLSRHPSASHFVIREEGYYYLRDGEFEFSGLTPGRYVLSTSIRAPFKSGHKAMRFYYPGTASRSEASEIAVGENESLPNLDINLPPEYSVRQIEGTLVWPDGSPVANGWVFLADAENSQDDDGKYEWESTDEQGRFSLEAFLEAEYWAHASVNTMKMEFSSRKDLWNNGIKSLKAQPVKIVVRKVNKPLKLVLQIPKGIGTPVRR